MPDFKTIANFRKDNGKAIRGRLSSVRGAVPAAQTIEANTTLVEGLAIAPRLGEGGDPNSPHGGARADSMAGPGVGVVGVPAKDSAPGNAS